MRGETGQRTGFFEVFVRYNDGRCNSGFVKVESFEELARRWKRKYKSGVFVDDTVREFELTKKEESWGIESIEIFSHNVNRIISSINTLYG